MLHTVKVLNLSHCNFVVLNCASSKLLVCKAMRFWRLFVVISISDVTSFFYDCIVYIMHNILVCTKKTQHRSHFPRRYSLFSSRSRRRWNDSPAAHKNQTVVFYIQKQITTSKLNNDILASTWATFGTLSIYPMQPQYRYR